MADWFRKKSWTADDEKEFLLRFGRARKDGRAQYLKVQAIELIDTKNKELLCVAEMLINKLFTEYPEDQINKSTSLNALGDIYKIRGDYDKAAGKYYKQAIDFEKIFPQVRTQAYLSYSELAVKLKKINLFQSIEDIVLERESSLLFPIEKYKVYSILATINKFKRNKELTKHYWALAENFANEKTSGLRYHKYLGLVKERDSWFDRLFKRK